MSKTIEIDLSLLPGWPDIVSGNHTLSVKLKAEGYRDSEISEGAAFNKASLAAPSILNLGNSISITDNDGDANVYDIYLNGVLVTTIPKSEV